MPYVSFRSSGSKITFGSDTAIPIGRAFLNIKSINAFACFVSLLVCMTTQFFKSMTSINWLFVAYLPKSAFLPTRKPLLLAKKTFSSFNWRYWNSVARSSRVKPQPLKMLFAAGVELTLLYESKRNKQCEKIKWIKQKKAKNVYCA